MPVTCKQCLSRVGEEKTFRSASFRSDKSDPPLIVPKTLSVEILDFTAQLRLFVSYRCLEEE